MNSKRLLCFLLGAALLLQTPATAYAEETLTYEQYKGGSGYSSTTQEQDYAIVEISTEEELCAGQLVQRYQSSAAQRHRSEHGK